MVDRHGGHKSGSSTSPWLYFIVGAILVAVVAYGAFDYMNTGDLTADDPDVNITTGMGDGPSAGDTQTGGNTGNAGNTEGKSQ